MISIVNFESDKHFLFNVVAIFVFFVFGENDMNRCHEFCHIEVKNSKHFKIFPLILPLTVKKPHSQIKFLAETLIFIRLY